MDLMDKKFEVCFNMARRSVDKVKNSLGFESMPDTYVHTLSISLHQDWFDVLISGQLEGAENLLKAATADEIKSLLNCEFDFEESNEFGPSEHDHFTKVNLPLHVAFCCGSKEVFEFMLENGADIFGVSNSNNLLHSAIISAFNRPQNEEDICQMISWLIAESSPENVTRLLFDENKDGFYPLEFAAQQGCLRIMKTLLETKGHVTSKTSHGLGVHYLHDVTVYETGDRHGKSPINMLAYLDKKKLQDPETAKIILSPLISDWIDKKIKSNSPLLLFWLFTRLLFISTYIVLDLDISWLLTISGNKTNERICPQLAFVNLNPYESSVLSLFLVFFSFSIFAVYIVEAVEKRRKSLYLKGMDLNGKKETITSIQFFKVVQALLVVAVLLSTIESLQMIFSGFKMMQITVIISDLTRSGIPVLCLWSICYFLQLIPSIGPSIISIQSMLVDMARFMLLFIIIIFPFIHAFQSFALINSNQGCVKEFESPLITSYTLFKMMMNIYDPSNGSTKGDYQNVAILYVLHALYILMVGVLLVNFLIAMMSNKAAEVADHGKVILKLNQLSIVVCLEERLFCIPVAAKWLYSYLKRWAFVCVDRQLYLRSVISRFGTRQ